MLLNVSFKKCNNRSYCLQIILTMSRLGQFKNGSELSPYTVTHDKVTPTRKNFIRMGLYLHIMIADAMPYSLLMQAVFTPTLLQNAANCVYDPIRYIYILIYICIVGSPVIAITSYISSKAADDMISHVAYKHYIRTFSLITFRVSLVIFILVVGAYLISTTVLPESVQACSKFG